jgi:hypothetical protein
MIGIVKYYKYIYDDGREKGVTAPKEFLSEIGTYTTMKWH